MLATPDAHVDGSDAAPRARSRNKDGKNVPETTTAFKTVASRNVTMAHAKIGSRFWRLAVARIVVM
jgi:hypothetical protein